MSTANSQHYAIPLEKLLAALEQPLSLIEDENRRTQTRAYLELSRVHLERAVLEMLSEAAKCVNDIARGVEARVQYGPAIAEWVVAPKEREPQSAAWFSDGDQEKVTVRIPSELKQLVGLAAARSGLSVNSWYIRTLAAALGRADEDAKVAMPGRSHTHHGHGSLGRALKSTVGR